MMTTGFPACFDGVCAAECGERIHPGDMAPWGHLNRSCTPYGCEPGCELEPVAKLIAADITRMEQGT
jgi:hypothetical protein